MSGFHAFEAGRFTLAPAARNQIKMATKELRHLTGWTIEDIAGRVGISKSQWHNYENLQAPDLIPLHIALVLELELGHAPVTRAIARMNGLSVLTEAQARKQAQLSELVAQAAREQGEALAVLAQAAADGDISPNEAKHVDAEFADVERVAGSVRTLAAQVIADKA